MGISDRTRMQALFTAATAVAAINSIVAGTGVAVLMHWLNAPLAVVAVVGVVLAVTFLGLHVMWEKRRYAVGLADG